MRDERSQERLLREGEVTVQKALDICHAAESSRQQLDGMKGAKQVFAVDKERQQQHITFPKQAKAKPAARAMTARKGDRKALLSLCVNTVARSTVLRHAGVQHLAKHVPSVEARITGLLYARVEAQEEYVFWMQIPSKVLKSLWS